jgi:hypothetical protein
MPETVSIETNAAIELERLKKARVQRLLKELNALSVQRQAIEEELRAYGWQPKERRNT